MEAEESESESERLLARAHDQPERGAHLLPAPAKRNGGAAAELVSWKTMSPLEQRHKIGAC